MIRISLTAMCGGKAATTLAIPPARILHRYKTVATGAIVDDSPQTNGRPLAQYAYCGSGLSLSALKDLFSVEANKRWMRFGEFVWQTDRSSLERNKILF